MQLHSARSGVFLEKSVYLRREIRFIKSRLYRQTRRSPNSKYLSAVLTIAMESFSTQRTRPRLRFAVLRIFLHFFPPPWFRASTHRNCRRRSRLQQAQERLRVTAEC